jgi:hypothetical protein
MPIFVSHSNDDEALYSAVCVALDFGGFARWDPSTMLPGESLAVQLRAAIQTCKTCIFIATPRSVRSAWCLAELGAFWGAGNKKIFLFVAGPDIADADFPPQFKGDLKVTTAQELFRAIRTCSEDDDLKWPQSFYYYGRHKTLRTDEVFQDFQVVHKADKGNINAIQYFWADTSEPKNEIKAHVNEGSLDVTFTNVGDSYPCNVAIRGQNEQPIRNVNKGNLVFSAKLTDTSCEVSIGVRVVDGFLRHWTYGSGASTYICQRVKRSVWTRIDIPLGAEALAKYWHRFESDGNPEGPDQPDFGCICSVILEFGGTSGSRPGPGTGRVAIGPIVLLNDPTDYKRYRECVEATDAPSRGSDLLSETKS